MSKESLPNETGTLSTVVNKETKKQQSASKTNGHDDFADILDYLIMESGEREKYKIDTDRQHAVVVKSHQDGANPTIGDLKNIKLE